MATKIYPAIAKQILISTIVQAFFLPFHAKYNPATKPISGTIMATKSQLSFTVSSREFFFVEIFSSLDNIFKLPSMILISESNPATPELRDIHY